MPPSRPGLFLGLPMLEASWSSAKGRGRRREAPLPTLHEERFGKAPPTLVARTWLIGVAEPSRRTILLHLLKTRRASAAELASALTMKPRDLHRELAALHRFGLLDADPGAGEGEAVDFEGADLYLPLGVRECLPAVDACFPAV